MNADREDELATLESERDVLKAHIEVLNSQIILNSDVQFKEVFALKAEVERLKAKIVDITCKPYLKEVDRWRMLAEGLEKAFTAHHDADNDGTCFEDCPSCKLQTDALTAYDAAQKEGKG